MLQLAIKKINTAISV